MWNWIVLQGTVFLLVIFQDYIYIYINLLSGSLRGLCSIIVTFPGYSFHRLTQRKHAYSYILKISPPKTKSSDKNSDIFHISSQHIDCRHSLDPPRRGCSNEYLRNMFLSKKKENNVYPCKTQFYYTKIGFKGVKIIKVYFRDEIPRLIIGKQSFMCAASCALSVIFFYSDKKNKYDTQEAILEHISPKEPDMGGRALDDYSKQHIIENRIINEKRLQQRCNKAKLKFPLCSYICYC